MSARKARRGSLRIIAGSRGGRRLAVPDSARPMTDRVRESLFSALGAGVLDDASVLDLYAGSGALAIEALSRGARQAVLVDSDRVAAETCRQNLAGVELDMLGRVVTTSVDRLLGGRPPPESPFDLVFLDPPYERPAAEVEQALERLTAPGWLAPAARAVVQRPARSDPVSAGAWESAWERRYGGTLVSVLAITG